LFKQFFHPDKYRLWNLEAKGFGRVRVDDKIARIGFLSALGEASLVAREAAFRAGLKELGYVEGKTYVIERRYSDGDAERLQRQAEELVRLKVDVIVTTGPTTTPAARKETATKSKASGTAQSPGVIEATAKALMVQSHYRNAEDLEQIEAAFLAAGKARDDAIIVLANAITTSRPAEIAGMAGKARLPAIYYAPDFADAGGLVVYGANNIASFRRAAAYVDKILKGAKPADLPIEQPTTFELVINLKTAKALGIKIPQSVLIRADRVIE
jgi:putative ABC transport system substrate-binding protein